MNETVKDQLELLKVMKDLNGQGFRLNNEINALIKSMLMNLNITDEFFNENSNVRKGTRNDPYVKKSTTSLVTDGKVFLSEMPDRNSKVIVRHLSEKLREVSNNSIANKEEYYVDYNLGAVYFHESLNKQYVLINYFGKGTNTHKIN